MWLTTAFALDAAILPLAGMQDITDLLARYQRGSVEDDGRLLEAVHGELRKIAAGYMRRERNGHTLQPTALVNEAYLRLVSQRDVRWQSRGHFFGIAASLMRRILVDHARKREATRRGGRQHQVTLPSLSSGGEADVIDTLSLHSALSELESLDSRQAAMVELKYFTGLNNDEIASVHGVSIATVKRELATANLWLRRRLAAER
jgi:RNA polymerase sigma factor (TIGR02999 family)